MRSEQTTSKRLHVQAHRGARSGKPENTLPAFELALDLGADSIEMDLRLSRDGVVVVFHDAVVSPRVCRARDRQWPRGPHAAVQRLRLAELRRFTADALLHRKPSRCWPATPLSTTHFAKEGLNEYAIPTLADVFELVRSYSSDGAGVGKSAAQQAKAKRVRLDLELKGNFRSDEIGALEGAVTDAVAVAGMSARVSIRSFDHRRLEAIKRRLPALRTGVLLTGTRPVDVVAMVQAAGADELYPDYRVIDEELVRQTREANIPVLAWTVNDEDTWARFAEWGIDGITTDYPGELRGWVDDQHGSVG